MVTKNSLLPLLVALSLITCLTACQSKKKMNREYEVGEVEGPSTQNPELQPSVEKPEFLSKQAPKLGLILGPGGALSFSQVGLLQELENQKIDIHSIAGVEWGALVAGVYSIEKKAHAVEWKLLKIPTKKFDNTSFFSSAKSPSVSEFDSYLKKTFASHSFQDGEISFTCPYVNIKKEKFDLYTRGKIRSAVRACWPSQPHFKMKTLGADINGIAQVAQFLRSQGAELIVYVDVLTRNRLLNQKLRSSNPEAAANLIRAKSLVEFLKPPFVDEVIRIPLSGQNVNSYKSLRSIVRMGQLKTKKSVQQLAKKYAY